MLPGLEDDLALALRAQAGLDRRKHVRARERECVDVLAREEEDLDHGAVPGTGLRPARRRSAGTAQAEITSAVRPTPR